MNETILLKLNSLVGGGGFVDYLVWFSAEVLIVVLIAFGSVCLIRDKKITRGLQHLFLVLFSALMAWAASELINYAFPSLRPYLVIDNLNLIFDPPASPHGYPSGHTAFIFGFTFMLIFFRKKTGIVFSLIALLVGFARVAGGVHWPIDILGGILIGMSSAFIIYYIHVKYHQSNLVKLAFWRK